MSQGSGHHLGQPRVFAPVLVRNRIREQRGAQRRDARHENVRRGERPDAFPGRPRDERRRGRRGDGGRLAPLAELLPHLGRLRVRGDHGVDPEGFQLDLLHQVRQERGRARRRRQQNRVDRVFGGAAAAARRFPHSRRRARGTRKGTRSGSATCVCCCGRFRRRFGRRASCTFTSPSRCASPRSRRRSTSIIRICAGSPAGSSSRGSPSCTGTGPCAWSWRSRVVRGRARETRGGERG